MLELLRHIPQFGRKAGVLVAAFLVLSGYSYSEAAEDIARTVRFDATNYTTQGELVGCGFDFSQVVPDHAYERGLPVILRGSINTFYYKSNPLNVMFKLRGESIDPAKMSVKPFQIHYAYLRADGQSFAKRERAIFRCEDGSFCSSYVEGAESIIAALFGNQVELSFNRHDGGLDVIAKLDITQAVDTEKNVEDGWACYRKLFGRFRAQD